MAGRCNIGEFRDDSLNCDMALRFKNRVAIKRVARRPYGGALPLIVAAAFAVCSLNEAPIAQAQGCPEIVGRWPYGPGSSVAIAGDLGLVVTGSVLQTLDLTDPTSPELVGELDLPFVHGAVAVSGSIAYVVRGDVLVIDVGEPSSPVLVETLSTDWDLAGATIVGQRLLTKSRSDQIGVIDIDDPSAPVVELLYDHDKPVFGYTVSEDLLVLAEFEGGFRVLDISDPQAVQELGFTQLPDQLLGLAVTGRTAFITGSWGLYSVDFDDPSEPTLVDTFPTDWFLFRPILLDDLLLVIHDDTELMVIDVGDPTNLTLLAELSGFLGIGRIAAFERLALLVDDDMTLVDLSDPETPTPVGVYRLAGSSIQSAEVGDRIVVASATELRVFDTNDPGLPTVVGELDLGGYGTGLAIEDEMVFVAEIEAGLRVVDVSDTADPTEIGFLEFNTGFPAKVAISGNYAFATNYWGIRMIDISDPTQLVTYTYGDCDDPQDIVADGDFVYAACGSQGLRTFEAWTGLGMQVRGSLVTDAPVTGVDRRGDYVFFVDGDLHVADVSDPTAPVEVGVLEIAEDIGDVVVIGNRAYAVGAVYRYAESVVVVDVGDPRNPVRLGEVETPGRPQDVDLVDGLLIVADSKGGLTVIKGCQLSYDGFESGDTAHWD